MCNTINDNTMNSSLVDDNRILKNKRISETRKSTRIKRKSQIVKTIEVKIVSNKLSRIQKEKLELLAKNENELIREYAIKQLNRHDFTDKDVEEQY